MKKACGWGLGVGAAWHGCRLEACCCCCCCMSATSETMACSRWKRLRMAWSVRPGSRCAIWYQRWPSSATEATMTASSARVHETRSGLASSDRLTPALARCVGESVAQSPLFLPPLPPAALRRAFSGGGGGSKPSPGGMQSLSRFQRFRTASSERPGSWAAIFRQRQPYRLTPSLMISSSAHVHSFRSGPLREEVRLQGTRAPLSPFSRRESGEGPQSASEALAEALAEAGEADAGDDMGIGVPLSGIIDAMAVLGEVVAEVTAPVVADVTAEVTAGGRAEEGRREGAGGERAAGALGLWPRDETLEVEGACGDEGPSSPCIRSSG
mmetsp:Transcript_32584/g.71513  ORF Transcript_32584/g.71513 Transcript_32584/m.71513 type:complete len:326 (-) Transcript_32584:16-993(-)